MLEKLKSRKFQLTIATVLITIGGYVKGDIEPITAIKAIVVAVIAYCGSQGLVDALKK